MKDDVYANNSDTDLLVILNRLWVRRKRILAFTAVGLILGLVFGYLKPDRYTSEGVISPKGGEASLAGGLAQLGFATGGASKVGQIALILNSRLFADSLIVKYGLLADIFSGEWDSSTKRWKDTLSRPTVRQGVAFLQKAVEIIPDERKNIVTIKVTSQDSLLPASLVNFYLIALKERMRSDIRADADSNRSYLESQFAETIDPFVSQKISSLIALEIEKSMLLRSQSFDIIEYPLISGSPSGPDRPLIAFLFSFAFFLGTVILSIFIDGITGRRLKGVQTKIDGHEGA